MTRYVLGFMFDQSKQKVLLIHKKRPEWQNGKLNGLGGKNELNELPSQAIVREFREESGIQTYVDEWQHFATMLSENWICYCFVAIGNIHLAKTTTDEMVEVVKVCNIDGINTISNVAWLVRMALNSREATGPLFSTIYYRG